MATIKQNQVDITLAGASFQPLKATATPFYQATIFNDLTSGPISLSINGTANYFTIQPGSAYDFPFPTTTSQQYDLSNYLVSGTGTIHVVYS